MRRIAIVTCVLALTACDTAETDTEAIPAAEEIAPAPQPQAQPMTSGSEGALAVDSTDMGQAYLTTSDGMALYALEGQDDPSACVDECAAAWPPYVSPTDASRESALGTGSVDAQKFGSVDRPDGATQLTYDGHPLYLYAKDTGPGEATGQDVTDEWGEWYLVQPSGELVHQ